MNTHKQKNRGKSETDAGTGKAAMPKAPSPFASDDKLLEAAVQVFHFRREYIDSQANRESSKKNCKSFTGWQKHGRIIGTRRSR